MQRSFSFILVVALAGAALSARTARQGTTSSPGAGSTVSVREDLVVIPTYPTGEPLKAPMFFAGRAYQGAKGPMYPYVLVDRLTHTLEHRTYRVIWLENEFVRIGILPELGGRIWEGRDKTNGYDFFYKNRVIKPALIGMIGAWISGGVEWNIPHHHRASSFMPVEYRIEEGPDGKGTVWLGELELRHRMRWTVGLTLSPGRSTLDATVRLINRTPVAHSFLYFANVAVHANDEYQVVFPPGTEFGTHHAKSQFTSWPMSRQVYGGVDFTRGVDVSWWKNHPSPTSIFAWNYEDDFLAGYDHGRQAGTMHVADRLTVPGKKFFEWGPGDEGQYWDSLLTDADGPYLELMVGGYSDNQPDYTWIQPAETKEITQTWYPIRNLGAPKHATREAAVNLEAAGAGAVRLALNATSVHRTATVRLLAGQRTLLEQQIVIGPAEPFSAVVTVPAGAAHADLVAILTADDGRELVRYQPRPPANAAMPPPVVPPLPPAEVVSNEELYLAGVRLDQFYSPAAEPEPYYEEAIRRDPGDSRARTALAIRLIKRGLFAEAAEHAANAAARVMRNYTSPRDGEPLYYLGLARLGLGDDGAAEPVLAKAAWDPAWRGAAYTRLAEIAARREDWTEVLNRTRRALAGERDNTRALALRAIALLKLARFSEAREATARALAVDPLDAWARDVEWLIVAAGRADSAQRAGVGVAGQYVSRGGEPEAVLEVASDYAGLGLYAEALALLKDRPSPVPPATEHAMIGYARADHAERLGRTGDASRFACDARNASPDYIFPFRIEHIAVLRRAMARDPGDPRAPYYLGNLLADIQPEAAVEAWRTAARLDPGFAMVHRNLGWMAGRRGETLAAIGHYERAIAAEPREPVFLYEIDRLHESANTDPSKRLVLLEAHGDTVLQRDDAVSRLVRLQVRLGQYDRALKLLSSRRFSTWEGGTRFLVHDDYVNAHLLRGRERLRLGRAADALRDFEAALEYPPNLGIGRPHRGGRTSEVHYHIGRAYAALGESAKAHAAWKAARGTAGDPALLAPREVRVHDYFQARALHELGEGARAQAIYTALVATGEERLARSGSVDFFAKFSEQQSARSREAQAHYLIGLGRLGQGRAAAAREAFEQVLAIDVNHVWAAEQLRAIRDADPAGTTDPR